MKLPDCSSSENISYISPCVNGENGRLMNQVPDAIFPHCTLARSTTSWSLSLYLLIKVFNWTQVWHLLSADSRNAWIDTCESGQAVKSSGGNSLHGAESILDRPTSGLIKERQFGQRRPWRIFSTNSRVSMSPKYCRFEAQECMSKRS